MDGLGATSRFRKYDFTFFSISIAIFLLGILNLYSATYSSSDPAIEGLYKVQVLWFVISFFVGVIVSFVQTKTFYRYSYLLYFLGVFLLLLVLVLGDKGMGAQRWLVIGPLRVQPSELMKLSVILALGRWFSKHSPDKELGIMEMIFPFLIAMLPAFLIIIEPDLGTGLLILLIFFSLAFYRRLKGRTIFLILVIAVASGKLMFEYGLKEYQKKRIMTFIDPDMDARGSGYNAIQSKIAIGSGQFFGKGLMKSSQASLNYLPENHTDFVFSIFNEEHGFFGSVFLIGLYLILFYRLIWLSMAVTHFYNSIVSIGILSMFFWHTFVNMGMVTGLLPIVGLPLPFMSYGGSSMLTFAVCIGIATSISNSRNMF